ncbi:MAG: hypothetical protein SGPRY_010272 [Prymnesium sp.]
MSESLLFTAFGFLMAAVIAVLLLFCKCLIGHCHAYRWYAHELSLRRQGQRKGEGHRRASERKGKRSKGEGRAGRGNKSRSRWEEEKALTGPPSDVESVDPYGEQHLGPSVFKDLAGCNTLAYRLNERDGSVELEGEIDDEVHPDDSVSMAFVRTLPGYRRGHEARPQQREETAHSKDPPPPNTPSSPTPQLSSRGEKASSREREQSSASKQDPCPISRFQPPTAPVQPPRSPSQLPAGKEGHAEDYERRAREELIRKFLSQYAEVQRKGHVTVQGKTDHPALAHAAEAPTLATPLAESEHRIARHIPPLKTLTAGRTEPLAQRSCRCEILKRSGQLAGSSQSRPKKSAAQEVGRCAVASLHEGKLADQVPAHEVTAMAAHTSELPQLEAPTNQVESYPVAHIGMTSKKSAPREVVLPALADPRSWKTPNRSHELSRAAAAAPRSGQRFPSISSHQPGIRSDEFTMVALSKQPAARRR